MAATNHIYQNTEADRDGSEQNEPLLGEYTTDDEFVESAKRRVLVRGYKKRLKTVILLTGGVLVIAAIILIPAFLSEDSSPKRKRPNSSSVLGKYQHAAVASDVGLCSDIGKAILEQGGSAVDAAIASLLCMGVGDPQSMGIGGGFLMTIYDKSSQNVTIIDSREEAPSSANKSMFVGHPELAVTGGLSIAVPGEVLGYWQAYQLFGELAWEDLFSPVIKMCVEGFVVPHSLASALQDSKTSIEADTQLRQAFVNPETNELYKTGETMKRPKLGETFKTIAKKGAMELYTGALVDDLVSDIQERDGIITKDDMKNYKVKVRAPSVSRLENKWTIMSPPPPGSGPVLEFILNILDGYKMSPASLDDEHAVLTYHRIIEAFKFAYAKRTFLGDEDFVDVAEIVKNMTSQTYAAYIRTRIWDNATHGTDYYGPVFDNEMKTGTAHLSVVAVNGDAVSVTSTVNTRFGSKILGNRTGILFNNEMDDFSTPNETNSYGLRPSPANFIAPGKRPLSSMCPAIILDEKGELQMVVGAAGGSRITTTTALVIAYALWFGDNIKQAIDEHRLHHQLLPTTAYYEEGFPQDIVAGLEKLLHNMTEQSLGLSIVQGIVRKNGLLEANCDFRKGGSPAGY